MGVAVVQVRVVVVVVVAVAVAVAVVVAVVVEYPISCKAQTLKPRVSHLTSAKPSNPKS